MKTSPAMTHPRDAAFLRIRRVLLSLVQIAFAAFFVMSGIAKLTGASEMVALFDAIGLGQWFRIVTGAVEVVGAFMLLVPFLSGVGALVLAAVMVGAVTTHLFVIAENPSFPFALLVIASLLAWARWDRVVDFVQPLRKRRSARVED